MLYSGKFYYFILLILFGTFFYFLSKLLIEMRFVSLPLDIAKYKKLIKIFQIISWGMVLSGFKCLQIFAHNRIYSPLAILIVVFLAFSVYDFLFSLSTLCPQCRKRIIDRNINGLGIPWGVDTFLRQKPCPNCNFKFEKTVVKEEENSPFADYLFPYLPIAVISFVIAVIGYGAYIFITSGRMNFYLNMPYVLMATAVISVIILFFMKRAEGLSKCSICLMSGEDQLKYSSGKNTKLCRIHLISELRKEYLKFERPMVVIYPDLEDKKKSWHVYQYYTQEELKKYNVTFLGELTRRGLSLITGNCQKCSALASVAFWDKGSFEWADDYPLLEQIEQKPQILCRECSFAMIEPSINNYKGYFMEPVISPHKAEGILIPWTV